MLLLIVFLQLPMLTSTQLEGVPSKNCIIRMSEDGNFVTLQGVVDAAQWPSGTYSMAVEARQAGSRSLSRQGGKFDGARQSMDGMLVVSSTTVYLSKGSRLAVSLKIEGAERQTTCSLAYER
ncbi:MULTISPECIES: curli-like amyloid fiber formation chaperone CsgH [Ponticoccus]|uniref:Curli-like amyloid fiber formation chaperone CsgH n=1 Tax=Ponticoccus litoralis TaxID=422297 RepID=A0AAW9SQ43_9RHOB